MIKIFLLISLISASSSQELLDNLLNPLFYTTEETVFALINYLEDVLNVTPQNGSVEPPIEEDVKFFATNRGTNELHQIFLNDSDLAIKVDLSKPFGFLIHGWTDQTSSDWIKETIKKWLEFFDINIILVDWERLAALQYWDAALESVPKVGNYTTEFLRFLVENGVSLDNVHLVGHSLGSHIGGLIGAQFDGKVANITGLDPAGPLFTTLAIRPIEERLDPSDARHVQCIYTTYGTMGSRIILGHENHFPNFGLALQPNCVAPAIFGGPNPVPLFCSHGMAAIFWKNSLDPNCRFVGSSCVKSLLGICTERVEERLGPHSSGKYGNFYSTTTLYPPYCQ